jgi:hypothetical protein
MVVSRNSRFSVENFTESEQILSENVILKVNGLKNVNIHFSS